MNKSNSTLNPLFTWHIPEEYLPFSRAHPKFTTPAVSNTSRFFNFFITAQNCCYIPFHQNKGSLMKHQRLYFRIECSIKSFHIVLRMIDNFCVYDPLIITTSPLSLLKSCQHHNYTHHYKAHSNYWDEYYFPINWPIFYNQMSRNGN